MKVVTPQAAVFIFLSTAILSAAQAPTQNLPFGPAVPDGQTIILNGKVTTEANCVPPASVDITLDCTGTQTAQTTTDPHGNFSISVRRSSHSDTADSTPSRKSSTDLPGCEVNASLAGYTAEPLHIVGSGSEMGVINAGTILLHPTAQAQSFSISVSSLAAPEKAKAAFEKGEEQKKKGKLPAAMESFRKAIAAYPRYALAWLELGRIQATQHNFADAQQSFRQSVNEDSKLVE